MKKRRPHRLMKRRKKPHWYMARARLDARIVAAHERMGGTNNGAPGEILAVYPLAALAREGLG